LKNFLEKSINLIKNLNMVFPSKGIKIIYDINNLSDGKHPNQKGIEIISKNLEKKLTNLLRN